MYFLAKTILRFYICIDDVSYSNQINSSGTFFYFYDLDVSS